LLYFTSRNISATKRTYKVNFRINKEFEKKVRELMGQADDEFGEDIHEAIWKRLNNDLVIYEEENKANLKFKTKHTKAELCVKNIMLALTYPRLDINVSKHLNHLLKAPFCIHPKTGLLSVPLNSEDILKFRLQDIPEVEETITCANENKKSRYNHYLENFKNFVDKLNNSK
jgi:DNA primase small subunit